MDLASMRTWVGGLLAAPPQPATQLTAAAATDEHPDTALGDIAQWLGKGFVLASALLTFFGIKEGQLDRILRNDPVASLFVIELIGLAVITGVVTPAAPKGRQLRLGVVVLAGTLLVATAVPVLPAQAPAWTVRKATWVIAGAVAVLVAGLFLAFKKAWVRVACAALLCVAALVIHSKGWLSDDANGSGGLRTVAIVAGIVAAGLVVAAFTWDRPVSVTLALIMIGGLAFSTGIYGALKLAVESKASKDRPELTVTYAVKDAKPTLSVHVKAGGMRTDEDVIVAVDGVRKGRILQTCGDDCIEGLRTGAGSDGTVDRTIDIPLPAVDFDSVHVRAFICSPRYGKASTSTSASDGHCETTATKESYADLTLPPVDLSPGITVSFPTNDRARVEASVAVSLAAPRPGQTVQVVVAQQRGPAGAFEVLARAGSSTGAGAFTETLPVALGRDATEVCVQAWTGSQQPPACGTAERGPAGTATVLVPVPAAPPPS